MKWNGSINVDPNPYSNSYCVCNILLRIFDIFSKNSKHLFNEICQGRNERSRVVLQTWNRLDHTFSLCFQKKLSRTTISGGPSRINNTHISRSYFLHPSCLLYAGSEALSYLGVIWTCSNLKNISNFQYRLGEIHITSTSRAHLRPNDVISRGPSSADTA